MSNEEFVENIQRGINVTDNLEKLYQQNFGFILKTAQKYTFMYESIEDLTQVAYLGLYKAVMMFDGAKEIKFITYAAHWIKQSITRHLQNNARNIRLPVHMQEKMFHYKKMVSLFEMKEGHVPADNEICLGLGWSKKILDDIKVACILEDTQSTDETIPDEEDIFIIDCAPDMNVNVEHDAINSIDENSVQSDLWELIKDILTPQQYKILICRYKDKMTLDEAGKQCNVSSSRAGQLHASALKKLRHPEIKKMLYEMYWL